ncbi:MAG: DUF427 domain-containing protein [Pseudomonadota bacterium]
MPEQTEANPAPGFEKYPDYEVNINPQSITLTVEAAGHEIARSTRAVELLETRHHPAWYIPLEDVSRDFIKPTDSETFCPFKGHASYWSIVTDDETIDDAIWAYLSPYDECLPIKGYASFYTNKVQVKIDGKPL